MYLGISVKDFAIFTKKSTQRIYQKENKSLRCSASDALSNNLLNRNIGWFNYIYFCLSSTPC